MKKRPFDRFHYEAMHRDVRFGLRMLWKNPGFTSVAVLALALGIGANTAIFSVVHAVLLRALPYPEQENLVVISEWSQQVPGMSVSYPNFLDWQARQKCFSAIGVSKEHSFNYAGATETERISGVMASHDVSVALGISAMRGRLFTSDDDKPGAEPTVVIRERFWKRMLDGRESAIGEKISLNGVFYTIIGILPDSSQISGTRTDLWTPLGLRGEELRNRWDHAGLYGVARLKPGVFFEAAQTEMKAIAAQLAKEHPSDNAGNSVVLERLIDIVFGGIRPSLYMLLGAAGFVLLIACANVANLQLARANARSREFAVRAALGAGWSRILWQLLVESLLLGLLGCILGLLLGDWAIHALRTKLPSGIPRLEEVGINGWVLAFAISASLVTSVVFGLAPAVPASRQDLRETLARGGRASGGRSNHRWHAALIVGEFALTCLLLVGACLMLRSLGNLRHADPGYTIERIATFNLDMPGRDFQQPSQRLSLLNRTAERLAAVAGVKKVGIVNPLPLGGGGNQSTYYIEGTPVPAPGQAPSAERIQVSVNYFTTLGIPLKKGRGFASTDLESSQRVAIVDTMFVEKRFQGQDPIGKRFVYGTNPPEKDSDWLQIVGVVGHIKNYGVTEPTREQTYLPYAQSVPSSVSVVLSTEGNPTALAPALRSAMHEVAGNLPMFQFRTMSDLFEKTFSTERLTMLLLSSFAALALLLAAVGLYGVLSYHVSQRTQEVGVRMALGATRHSVAAMTVKQGLKLAIAGLLIGFSAAFALTRFLQNLLYGITPMDPWSFVTVAAVLFCVGVMACWLPARRAAKVNPMEALRQQ